MEIPAMFKNLLGKVKRKTRILENN